MNTFRRHFGFIYEIVIIHLKVLREYKSNFFATFITNTGFLLTLFFGFYILKTNFGSVFYWSYEEFIFSLLFLEYFLYVFHPWFRKISVQLLSGNFNYYLTKPINVFVNYMFSTVRVFVLVYSNLILVLLIFYLVFFLSYIDISKLFISIVFAIFGGFFYFNLICFLDSLGFFMKENKFLQKIYEDVGNLFSQYPISFFSQSPIYFISYILGYSYFSFYVTDYYFGYIGFDRLFTLFIILICLIFVLSVTSYFLWKFGLKRYEAYG